jgi:alpha-galactosidase
MDNPKITLIGAGSAVFSLLTLYDLVKAPELEGCEVFLMDINPERLTFATKLAKRLREGSGARLRIVATTNRQEALDGADFVILSIERDRMRTWRLDWEIPVKYGVKQVIGECGGPGGLAHTLRIVPDVVEIAQAMEDHCPEALLINYTNPEGRVCLAVARYTRIRVVGLCPGIYEQLATLAPLLGVPPEELDARAFGLNHFTWIRELRFKDGRDAYPLLKARLKAYPNFQPLCQELYRLFGLYPSPSDNHVGEYLSFGWELCPESVRGLNWITEHARWCDEMLGLARQVVAGSLSFRGLEDVLRDRGLHYIRGRAIDMIVAITANRPYLELAVNIPNQANIANLPDQAIVEVPALIGGSGVHGIGMGTLPRALQALCRLQITIQELAVEAALTGSKELALQALVLDPTVPNPETARKVLEALLEAHAPYLPKFRP